MYVSLKNQGSQPTYNAPLYTLELTIFPHLFNWWKQIIRLHWWELCLFIWLIMTFNASTSMPDLWSVVFHCLTSLPLTKTAVNLGTKELRWNKELHVSCCLHLIDLLPVFYNWYPVHSHLFVIHIAHTLLLAYKLCVFTSVLWDTNNLYILHVKQNQNKYNILLLFHILWIHVQDF